MREQDSVRKKLFVCTKPYQYLICRLIKEGYRCDQSDLLVLNHFEGAEQFVEAVSKLGIWEQVFFEDDTILNKRNAQLGILQKFTFYHNWKRLLPSCIASYEEYDELYFAHEGVAMEYGLMRQFAVQGKPAIVYEEGFGNYISVNLHAALRKRLLKEISHWLGIPGSYIGRLKYVDAVLLQRPDILDERNPISRKARPLPLTLHEFLSREHIRQEMCNIYPEIRSLSSVIGKGDAIAVLLGESWWDTLPNREQYIRELLKKIIGADFSKVFVKQHPGEIEQLEGLPGEVEFIPKRLPLELLYLAIKERIKRLCLFTFGSTAVFNLYELFSDECDVKIIILRDLNLDRRFTLGSEKFRAVADKLGVVYSVVKV